MAEFTSAVVGLAMVGAQMTKALHSLIETYKDAPMEILAFIDEVRAFRTMLSMLEEVDSLEQWTPEERAENETCLGGILENGKRIAQKIDKLIDKVQKEGLRKNGEIQVNRLLWVRIIKKARKLQESLRTQKAILCNFLTVRTLKCSARHGLHVTRLEMKMDMIIKNQLSLIGNQNGLMQESENQQKQDDETYDTVPIFPCNNDQQTISSGWSAITSSSNVAPSLSLSVNTPLSFHHSNTSADSNIPIFSFSSVSVATSLSCLKDCQCQCHLRSVIRSPRLLSNYLGNIVLGFSNLPWAFSRFLQCNEQTCRRMRSLETEVKYVLPSWFSSAVANFKIDLSVRFLPLNIHVRALNVIPYDSPILVCTQEGDHEGIMRLLQSGTASLYDVDPYGLGLLYYASYYCWRGSGKEIAMRTCRFLVDIGADTDLEDERGCTPLDTLIGDTLVSLSMKNRGSRMLNSSDFEHITQLFGKSSFELVTDFVKTSNFAPIHKVLLGIQGDHQTLGEYLEEFNSTSSSSETIDIPDSTGRSALAWAVEYGWIDATKTLLQYGANPNQLVRSSGVVSPLLHLAIAMPVSENTDNGSLDVVKELLRAGASINAVDHENWTPLHVAASWNNYSIIRELADFGGDTLDWGLVTNDNQSAMDLSLNAGINGQVQGILKNHELSREQTISTEDRQRGAESSESEEEHFFDSEEGRCCA